MIKIIRSAIALAMVLYVGVPTENVVAATPSGSKLVNQASASFQNGAGATFNTVSNTVSVTVATVTSLAFGPSDTTCPVPADNVVLNTTFNKTFIITNTSNGPDSYDLSSLSVTSGSIVSSTFVANGVSQVAVVGGAPSPVVAPGQSIQFVVGVNTNKVPPSTKILISASVKTTATSANGMVTLTDQQCAVTQNPPVLVGSGGAGSIISKTVNGVASVQSASNDTVQFDVNFRNIGGSPSYQTSVDDPVPAGITPILSSLAINGVPSASSGSLTGQDLKVAVGTVQVGSAVDISFKATVASQSTGSTFVNTANVLATGLPAQLTKPASVLIGSGDVVYDGIAGQASPIVGATVELVDQSGTTPVMLNGVAVPANPDNTNPMITKSGALYGFGFNPPKGGGTYILLVSAPGYLTRRIQVSLVPDSTGTLYSATLTSLDAAPLAIAGGFSLIAGPVTTSSVYGLFGNIPLFRPSGLVVTKSVDRNTASGGDRLIYTLTVANSSVSLGQTTVEDDLPPYVSYAPGTGRVDGQRVEPQITKNELVWTFPDLSGPHTIVFAAVVLPNVPDSLTLTNRMQARAAIPGSAGYFASGQAQAQTQVIPGIFTDRFPITGRVYVDNNDANRFLKGDVGVPNVRLVLEDGESVVTDGNGRYDFPAVRPGMHVLHLDDTTLPAYTKSYDTRAYNDERSIVRLVHGPFDGGLLQDINFGVKPVGPVPVHAVVSLPVELPVTPVGVSR